MYNETYYDNVNNTLDMVQATNNVSDGLFFALCVLLISSLIIFIALKTKYDVVTSMIATSFFTGLISVMGWGLHMVKLQIVFYPIILLIAGILIYMLQE